MDESFYGPLLARVHDTACGALAEAAATTMHALLGEAGHDDGLVIDLGCGSGLTARRLTGAGYTVIGVDLSTDLLEIARRRVPEASFRHGSLWEFALPPAVGVVAAGECFNYVATPDTGFTLDTYIPRVADAVVHRGVFLFDVAGPGRVPGGEQTLVHDHDDWTLIMHAREDPNARHVERHITVFARQADGYVRTDETHRLRLHAPEEVEQILDRAGLHRIDASTYDGLDMPPALHVFAATTP